MVPCPGAPGEALPPCGEPGTISTVTAPDGGDYIAAFSGYKVYPPQDVPGYGDRAAAPEYRSRYPQYLAVDPQGRVHVADWTIIYRLEADGSATRIVGVPQYLDHDGSGIGHDRYWPPRTQKVNVLVDTVAALDARIAPGAMAFDRQGRLYFVDYVDASQVLRVGGPTAVARIARLETDGRVVTFAGLEEFGWVSSLVFDLEGHLLLSGHGGVWRIDGQGDVSGPMGPPGQGALQVDDQGGLYFRARNQVFRRHADGTIEHMAGSAWEDRKAMREGALAGEWSEPRPGGYYVANGGPATEAPFDFVSALALDSDGWMVATAVGTVEEEEPASGAEGGLPSVRLWPNPTNASVTVAFELDHPASVSVRVYDELGQRVRVLAAEAERPAGSYQFVWDGLDQAGRPQASGTYFLVVTVDGTTESHKLTLLH